MYAGRESEKPAADAAGVAAEGTALPSSFAFHIIRTFIRAMSAVSGAVAEKAGA